MKTTIEKDVANRFTSIITDISDRDLAAIDHQLILKLAINNVADRIADMLWEKLEPILTLTIKETLKDVQELRKSSEMPTR